MEKVGGENTEKERYLKDFFSYKKKRYAELRNMPYHLKVVESLKMGFFLKALKKGIEEEKKNQEKSKKGEKKKVKKYKENKKKR